MVLLTGAQGGEADMEPTPTRGLKGYKETLNVSLPKPVFYDDTDPHYPQNNLETNTWEDVAFVVLLQDMNKVTKRENDGARTSTATCADIYQAAFIPLDGKTVSTGTQQRVMVEDFTATWCTYCTGVIGAMNRLDLDATMWPDKYIGVEWHSGGGTYGTGVPYDKALQRRGFYNIEGGIPRYIIDGMDPWVGGSSSANETSIDSRIRSSISERGTVAPISIQAHAGHTSSEAWVEFTFTVESDQFTNKDVEAHVILVQDAYPRRHGTNANARLGWIGQNLYTQEVMQLQAPMVQFREDRMVSDISNLGHVEGEFKVQWQASDKEDGSQLDIDLFYRQDRDDWIEIAVGVPNSGSYMWDTLEPRVPDGEDYQFRIVATDRDGMNAEAISSFSFEINNPDAPVITILEPVETGTTMTGTGEFRWRALDDEDDPMVLDIDLWISADGGGNYDVLATKIRNTGSHTFDTTDIADGDDYVIKARVTDPRDLFVEGTSVVFSIFNNDPPVAEITYPEEGDTVSGEIEILWDSIDQEDELGDMTYDLFIMYTDDGIWSKLSTNQINRGSYDLDTTQLEFGDGDYQIRLILRDSNLEYSEPQIVEFTVYNPDLPVISNAVAPRSPLKGIAIFTYTASDPDTGETEMLTVSFLISGDGIDWTPIEEGAANTGSFELDLSGMDDGEYQLKVVVADPVTGGRTEYVYPEFEVNNPDAPTIQLVQNPSPGERVSGDVPFSWSAQDLDGDSLKFYLYYSPEGDSSWFPIMEAQGIASSSFIWNTTTMDNGNYTFKVVVRDWSIEDLQAEAVTQAFYILNVKPAGDDDDTSGDVSGRGSDGGSDTTLIIIIVAFAALIIILVLAALLVLVFRKPQQAAPTPPPGYHQLPQGITGGQLPQGQVGAQLPPRAQPQLPPGASPQQQAPLPPPAPQTSTTGPTYIPPQN
jgi:hypothetical protein